VGGTFAALGWHVQSVADGNDIDAVDKAIAAAKAVGDRPSLVIVRTHIGFGSPKQDTFGVHGSPLNAADVETTKRALGYPSLEAFHVPDEARAHCRASTGRGAELEAAWGAPSRAIRVAHPDLAAEWRRVVKRELPAGWDAGIPTFAPGDKPMATRSAGGKVLNANRGGRFPRSSAAPRTSTRRRTPPSRAWATSRIRVPRGTTARARSAASGATPAATCTTAFASTPWARSPTVWRSTEACARSRRRS